MKCKKLKGCGEHGDCAKIEGSDPEDFKPHTCECEEARIVLDLPILYLFS